MIINNRALSNQSIKNHAANDDTFSANSHLFARLSFLSKRPRWVMFTADATLPTIPELTTHGIDSTKVVKIKASEHQSEKAIILKVLTAKNASAIVASDNFTLQEKQDLTQLALEADCELFFMDQAIRNTLVRHLH